MTNEEKKETKENSSEKEVESVPSAHKDLKAQEKGEQIKKEESAGEEVEQKVTNISPGMIIRVHQEIKETDAKGKEKQRIQVFEGIVISVHRGKSPEATFTVRKIATGGVGVEKIFPLYLPSIKKIEIVKEHKTRRAKLYYLRGKYKKKLKEIKDKIKK
ncbi:50S ribosomal protein L19 [Patescibacteria group bacterium]|nr:50S ribosomal protein L19 [Patescibacteria group bacterium]